CCETCSVSTTRRWPRCARPASSTEPHGKAFEAAHRDARSPHRASDILYRTQPRQDRGERDLGFEASERGTGTEVDAVREADVRRSLGPIEAETVGLGERIAVAVRRGHEQ